VASPADAAAARAAGAALIQIRDVGKSYRLGESDVHALRGVNFTVPQGGIVALMGPSGSGKSTLLNLIGALDTPTSGKVVVSGMDVAKLSRDEQSAFRNATIGFIFQNFNLVPVLTTLENVMLPGQLGRHSEKSLGAPLAERARHLLVAVGLERQINQSVNRLSGGQMQRVSIARALMNRPPIILADEPTANLDHETADTVLTVLKETCTREGATVVVATHDQHVLSYCHRIIRLMDGRLLRDEIRDNA
jgi:putative ABC transport system ATP-binding protein